jgi:hypothetical protein
MAARGFERRAAFFAAVSLAGMMVAFAIGQAQAQQVNHAPPPPVVNPVPPPAPTFNPSNPGTVPQAPETPVSPSSPSGLSGTGPAPGSPTVVPPASVNPQTPHARATAMRRARHHRRVRERWSQRRARFHGVRVVGPSYYPGLGEFYPPYIDPCHFKPVWDGFYGGYWAYACSW